uniref:Uncharacterized protein n=1 Tax=Anopheles atroparvus TaxID=41427 RepID=A0AAG5DUH5_ANOAO
FLRVLVDPHGERVALPPLCPSSTSSVFSSCFHKPTRVSSWFPTFRVASSWPVSSCSIVFCFAEREEPELNGGSIDREDARQGREGGRWRKQSDSPTGSEEIKHCRHLFNAAQEEQQERLIIFFLEPHQNEPVRGANPGARRTPKSSTPRLTSGDRHHPNPSTATEMARKREGFLAPGDTRICFRHTGSQR